MSAIFNGTSSVIYLDADLIGTAGTPDYPVLVHALVKLDELGRRDTVASCCTDLVAASTDWLNLSYRGELANDPVQVQVLLNSASTAAGQVNNRVEAAGIWYRMIGFWPSASSRFAWLDGFLSSDPGTTRNAVGLAYTVLGANWHDSAPQNFFKGRLAEFAIWNGGDGSSTGDYRGTGGIIDQLSEGISPHEVSDGGATLRCYKSLLSTLDGANDVGGLGDWTAADITYDATDHANKILTYSFKSPDVTYHQGYTTDGTYHYLSDTAFLKKLNDDATWSLAAEKLTGIYTGSQDHFGDVAYEPTGGLIWGCAYKGTGTGPYTEAALLAFDPSDLTRVASIPLPNDTTLGAGALVAVGGELFVLMSQHQDRIYRYIPDSLSNPTALTFNGYITLTGDVGVQCNGIAYKHGYFYVNYMAGALGLAPQRLYRCTVDLNANTGTTELVIESGLPFAGEGMDWSQDELRWLIDGGNDEHVYYSTLTAEVATKKFKPGVGNPYVRAAR